MSADAVAITLVVDDHENAHARVIPRFSQKRPTSAGSRESPMSLRNNYTVRWEAHGSANREGRARQRTEKKKIKRFRTALSHGQYGTIAGQYGRSRLLVPDDQHDTTVGTE